MGGFYDPVKKKPQPFVYAIFVIVPIILIIVGYVIGMQQVEKKKNQAPASQEKDIFNN